MPDAEPQPASPRPRFGRRTFLAGLGGGLVALLLPLRFRRGSLLPSAGDLPGALAARPYRAALPIPRVLRGRRLRIPIREASIPILPGRKTRMWTYGGEFPGPTIRRPAGKRTRVRFTHRLGRKAGELSVHLHGGHNRSKFDGQPGGLTASFPKSLYCKIPDGLSAERSGNNLLIEPGESRTYTYEGIENGGPERAAFQWYHDHRLDHTARNVWRGLAGMWIIDDPFDRSLKLPKGDRDIPLMITDRSFDRHNQLTNPFTNRRPPNDGVVGNLVLVNGAYLPHHHVSARRYRLRVLNASNIRPYNLFLSNGEALTQIATDSGLMPQPVLRPRVLVGPGERVEVIVDFARAAGKSVELLSGYRLDGGGALGARPFVGPLMQFRVGGRRRDRTHVPRNLRPLPAWIRRARRAPDRTWVITLGGGFSPSWLINRRTFSPARSDAHPALGTVETWAITNRTAVTHIIHMHHTDWYMLARNGRRPQPEEDCLKETFFVGPGETIHVAGHFSDFTGPYVIHCHMLDHEDHGLMAQFTVVRSRGQQPRNDEVARRRRGEIPTLSAAPTLGLPDRLPPGATKLELTAEPPAGETLERLDVAVDGELVRTLSGTSLAEPLQVDLATGGRARVTLVGQTPDGRMISATRDY